MRGERLYWEMITGFCLSVVAVILYILTAGSGFDVLIFAAFLGLLLFFAIALVYSLKYYDPFGPPVRLYSDGTLEIGCKRLPMADVSEIVVLGRTGPAEFRARNGRELACVTKTQIMNVNDFVAIVKREHPHVTIRADTIPVQVRMAKE